LVGKIISIVFYGFISKQIAVCKTTYSNLLDSKDGQGASI